MAPPSLGRKEPKIKFQEEIDGKGIKYLDLDIKIDNSGFRFDIYRKETYTDVIIPEESYHPIGHNMGALNFFVIGQ